MALRSFRSLAPADQLARLQKAFPEDIPHLSNLMAFIWDARMAAISRSKPLKAKAPPVRLHRSA